MPDLILGSSSPYRRELLARLAIPFTQTSPAVDETRADGESPQALAIRLSRAKADAIATRHPGSWVIGSDQVAALGEAVLGKPGTAPAACEQLRRCSGATVCFHTAICLQRDDRRLEAVDRTEVRFRHLRDDEIARYVALELPLDCAGSFKAEALGITLFEAVETHDPTAIIGLPLIALARLLREAGFSLP